MQDPNWSQLKTSFPKEALEWRVVELSSDASQARVRAQLPYEAVISRLDDVMGATAWSNRFLPIGIDAVSCELSIHSVSKSAVVSFKQSWQDAATAAYDALVRAAEQFGLLSWVDTSETHWVDFDLESHSILFEPEVLEATPSPALEFSGSAKPLIVPEDEILKPEGQQVIDRLVERLKQNGFGLEAAKLLIAYGGYGSDSDSARELYSKLRALLVEGNPA